MSTGAIVPSMSFGNSTGIVPPGMNPNGIAQTMQTLALFNPAANPGQVGALGTNNGSPFAGNPAPSTPGMSGFITGAPVPQTPAPNPVPSFSINPQNNPGAQVPTTQFGFPSGVPSAGTVPGAPANANLPGQNPVAGLTPGGGVWSPTNPGGLDPRLQNSLDKTYGKGFGNTIYNTLSQGAGFNPTVANAFLNDIQPYFQSNLNQVLESFGVGGGRFSSNAALAGGQAAASFTAQESAMMAQMYQWAYGNYLQTLMAVGSKNTSSGFFGNLNNILGIASAGAGAAGVGLAAAGGGGGTAAAVLAGIAAL